MLLILDCQDPNSRLLQRCLDSLPCPAILPSTNVEHKLLRTLGSRIEVVVRREAILNGVGKTKGIANEVARDSYQTGIGGVGRRRLGSPTRTAW